MSFDVSKVTQQSLFCIINNGFPGLFAYYSTTDTLAEILENGYFPADPMYQWVGATDFILLSGTDSCTLGVFDEYYHILNPVITPPINIQTITGSSGELSVNTCYIINISSNGTYPLPGASDSEGQSVLVKKTSGLVVTVTISAIDGQTIDGSSTLVMTSLNSKTHLISDGSNWFSI